MIYNGNNRKVENYNVFTINSTYTYVMSLNEKQERFAQSYILHRNATEAAKTAGYAEKSAYNQGYRNLQIEEIRDRIEELENNLETNKFKIPPRKNFFIYV